MSNGVTGAQGATGPTGPQGATGSTIITTLNFTQSNANSISGVTTTGTTIVSTTITSTGLPIQLIATGDANPTSGAGQWCQLQLYRNSTAIGKIVQAESSAQNENIPYTLNFIDTPGVGTFIYSVRPVTINGTWQFGEASGNHITAVELGGVQGPTGPQGSTGSQGIQGVTGPTGFGLPTGGTIGQILTKVDSTNYNTQWIDNGVQATYIMANNGSAQVIPTATQVTITNWSNQTTINASEWNSTTGVFTATKSGIYLVTGNLTYASVTDTINAEYSMNITKNGIVLTQARFFVPLNQTSSSFKQTNVATAIISVTIGDTIAVAAGQFTGSNRALHTNGNTITIQELPSRIIR
jgi:hypothetical protein